MSKFKMISEDEAALNRTIVTDAFGSIKAATDSFILRNNTHTYCNDFLPRVDELAIALLCNAFEELGCPIRSAAPGTKIERISHPPIREKLINHMYNALESKAGLLDIRGSEIIRTTTDAPSNDIETLREDLLDDFPAQEPEVLLTCISGGSFAKCITGEEDVLRLLFGTDQGRALMTKFYSRAPLFNPVHQQCALFIEKIASSWPKKAGPLRILEVGAGTGGTTYKIVPVLARLGVPVVYTMTDIGTSFGAAAQAKMDQYPFLQFKTLDIEKDPDASLYHTQHVVLGSNVIHATRDLSVTLRNVHKLLRPNEGIMMIHELTSHMLWADVAFGLIPGWTLFEDGREHALQSPKEWSKALKAAGFGTVDWTEGERPETKLQALILGIASSA